MKYATWAAMAVLTLIVGSAGIAKLTGVTMVHESFAVLGLPAWFGYFIGTCEVAGAIGIWLRRTSLLAALGLAIILVGALYYHVTHTPIAQGTPAFVALLCSGWIISRRGTGVLG
jgi:hypothetical protein